MIDTNVKLSSTCSSSGRYSNPDKNKVTPLRRITPQRITPQNESTLALKTPLQEISETLTESLKPSETFHGRNYFAEVQGQLQKMYKQSSVNSQVQRKADSVGVSSDVQKRCLKRKSVENSSTSENIRNRWRTQTTTSDCLIQTERHKPDPQTESSEKVRQENRVVQTVPVKELNSNSSRETSQSSKYQDQFYNGVTGGERELEKEKENNLSHGRDVQDVYLENRTLMHPTQICKPFLLHIAVRHLIF